MYLYIHLRVLDGFQLGCNTISDKVLLLLDIISIIIGYSVSQEFDNRKQFALTFNAAVSKEIYQLPISFEVLL